MSPTAEEARAELWRACLARVDAVTQELFGHGRFSTRLPGYFDKDERTCLTVAEFGLDDGSTEVHVIKAHLQDRGEPRVEDRVSWHSSEWHWERIIADEERPRVVVNAMHYRIGPEQTRGGRDSRGHAGRRFTIRFHDGREVVTTNLWFQGKVPPKFRDRLPDNAVFVPDPPMPSLDELLATREQDG